MKAHRCNGGCAGSDGYAPTALHNDHRDLDTYRVWGGLDYLLWKVRDQKLPALDQMFPFALTGFDRVDNQTTLAEGMHLSYPDRSGFRLFGGVWADAVPAVDAGTVARAAKNASRSAGRTSQREPARVAASFTRSPLRAGQPGRVPVRPSSR